MKKNILFLLFSFIAINLEAGILDRVSEITEKNHISFYYGSYLFSLYMDGNYLTAEVYSDAGGRASIVAYKIVDNTLKVIVQHRIWEFVTPLYDAGRFEAIIKINYYYIIEFEEIDGKLEYFCNRIREMNLNNFVINDAKVYDKTKVRFEPSIQSNRALELEKGTPLKITGVEKDGESEHGTFDYFFKVIIQEKIYWLYGFFVNFEERIRLLP